MNMQRQLRSERRGGRAMTRLQPASAIATLFLLGLAATASADRGWILWSQGVRDKTPIAWFSVRAYPSLNDCKNALEEAAVGLQKSGYDLVDTAESITAIKDDDNFTGLTCLPDTVDPRWAERRTNDAP
jgi:hypothetical protein